MSILPSTIRPGDRSADFQSALRSRAGQNGRSYPFAHAKPVWKPALRPGALSAELQEDSVIRKFRTTAADGKNCQTQFYNLDAINEGLKP